MAHAVPLVNNRLQAHSMSSTFEKRIEAPIVLAWVDLVDPLVFNISDPRTEDFAKHRKGSEINLCVGTGIIVPFFRIKVADVIEIGVQDFRIIPIRCFFREIVEKRIIIRDKLINPILSPKDMG